MSKKIELATKIIITPWKRRKKCLFCKKPAIQKVTASAHEVVKGKVQDSAKATFSVHSCKKHQKAGKGLAGNTALSIARNLAFLRLDQQK